VGYNGAKETREAGGKSVYKEIAPETEWSTAEETVLMLARESEWAEAYAAEHPKCEMGCVYLAFLRWELVLAQSKF